jgi:hypothetical protein
VPIPKTEAASYLVGQKNKEMSLNNRLVGIHAYMLLHRSGVLCYCIVHTARGRDRVAYVWMHLQRSGCVFGFRDLLTGCCGCCGVDVSLLVPCSRQKSGLIHKHIVKHIVRLRSFAHPQRYLSCGDPLRTCRHYFLELGPHSDGVLTGGVWCLVTAVSSAVRVCFRHVRSTF